MKKLFFKQSFVPESCRSYALKELRHPLDTEQTLLDLQQAHQLLVVSRKGPCPPHSGEQLRVQHASCAFFSGCISMCEGACAHPIRFNTNPNSPNTVCPTWLTILSTHLIHGKLTPTAMPRSFSSATWRTQPWKTLSLAVST